VKKTLTESELKEFILQIYEEEKIKLDESKWYNTVGDFVGIIDPTGIVDLVNGVSYWRQGDKLFALLSFISAAPILGDAIAKPVIGVMKIGGETAKVFRAATIGGDAVKMAQSAKSMGGPVAKLVETSPNWGQKVVSILKQSVGKVPGLGGLIKVIEEYVLLFTKASKEMNAGGKVTAFRRNAGELQSFGNKYISGGMGRLFGNRATRSLMRRSKWYLRLLDKLGVHNFVGPDELKQQIPNLETKMAEFNQDPSNQELYNQEFGDDFSEYDEPVTNIPKQPTTQSTPTTMGGDFVGDIMKSMFGSGIKIAA
jgi:hypothetical protein